MAEDSLEAYTGQQCPYCGTLSNIHLDGCPNQYRRLLEDGDDEEEPEQQ
jgi:hypothetical protein